jgi:hypothetical protein
MMPYALPSSSPEEIAFIDANVASACIRDPLEIARRWSMARTASRPKARKACPTQRRRAGTVIRRAPTAPQRSRTWYSMTRSQQPHAAVQTGPAV